MKICLIGFNCHSGLGEKNRQLSAYLDIDTWLIVKSRGYKTLAAPENVPNVLYWPQQKQELIRLIESVDVILFDETPYIDTIPSLCKRYGKRCVCILALEWFPLSGWIDSVDLFICPTRQSYDFYAHEFPCTYFPWPIDTRRFVYTQRNGVSQFLFLNGHGGWKGRKGFDVICKAKEIWPEMPLIVRSQRTVAWPKNVMVLPSTENNRNLYSEGDVLVSPHSVDGTGLEPMEAMSSGMPVITTDGLPWNEIPSVGKIQSQVVSRSSKPNFRSVPCYLPDPGSLVDQCKRVLGSSITEGSQDARKWAEQRSFSTLNKKLREIVLFGEPG